MNNVIEHKGVVSNIDGKNARVLIIQTAACAGCHAKDACTAADKSEKIIEAEMVDADLQPGDHVIVFGQRKLGLKAVLLAFILPFLLILMMLLILSKFIDNEAVTGTASLGILIVYYIVLSFFKGTLKREFQFYAKKY